MKKLIDLMVIALIWVATILLFDKSALVLANKEITQEERVNQLLTELVIEDYSTSLPDYYQFGSMLEKEIKDSKPWKINKIFFTSYNPEVGQTDSSPCTGAGLTNICQLHREGIRTIALSQDLVGRASWKKYNYGDIVTLHSDNPQCNGEFQIEDTMNKRYKNRGDIFQPTRATNTSCWATII